jgi:hypothetical protein
MRGLDPRIHDEAPADAVRARSDSLGCTMTRAQQCLGIAIPHKIDSPIPNSRTRRILAPSSRERSGKPSVTSSALLPTRKSLSMLTPQCGMEVALAPA